jgi:hypothetical protein
MVLQKISDVDNNYFFRKKSVQKIMYFRLCKNDKFLDHSEKCKIQKPSNLAVFLFLDWNINYFQLKFCTAVEYVIVNI